MSIEPFSRVSLALVFVFHVCMGIAFKLYQQLAAGNRGEGAGGHPPSEWWIQDFWEGRGAKYNVCLWSTGILHFAMPASP